MSEAARTVRVIVRPIRYTARADAVTAVLRSLGMRVDVDHGTWRVLSCGSGRVAVHAVAQGDPLAGTTAFGLELARAAGTADLDAFASFAAGEGVAVQQIEADHGPSVRIVAGPHVFLADLPTPVPDGRVPDPDLAVLALLQADDAPALAARLSGLGLRRRIEAESQTWFDLAGDAGYVGVHAEHTAENPDHAAVELHFEHGGDLAAVAERLAAQGIGAPLVDESWGQSLRVPDPDGGEIFVNAEQTDLYGYRKVG